MLADIHDDRCTKLICIRTFTCYILPLVPTRHSNFFVNLHVLLRGGCHDPFPELSYYHSSLLVYDRCHLHSSPSSHHHSPIFPDHVRPARSVPELPTTTAASAPVGPSPTHCRYPGCSTWSRGHHVTIAQPCIMKATSLAVHLVSRHGPWGFQPPFHAILVSYTSLMPLYRLQDRWIHTFPHSRIGGWLYASLSLTPSAVLCCLHADSHPSYRDPPFPA